MSEPIAGPPPPNQADTLTLPGVASAPSTEEVVSVPGYDVLGVLGRGGMGVVYRARHLKLDRVVALKMVLAGGHASEQDLARFLGEAMALAALQHPNVVQVFDTGRHQGLPYLALEFVPGGSLADRLRESPLPARTAASMVRQIARGMEAAHQKGIVHRDLKPHNVLLAPSAEGEHAADENWVPKVTDFGLAKRVSANASDLTHTGQLLGTPSYMAPEQADGKANAVGPAADVWALGAILYECLTGRPPFKGATAMETLLQVIEDDPVPVRAMQPKCPRDLETICLKCLQKEPARRYAGAGSLADDLGRFLAGEPIVARPVGVAERAVKWARRHPAAAGAIVAGALVVVLVVTLALSWMQAARLESEVAQGKIQMAQRETEMALTTAANEKDAREKIQEQEQIATRRADEAEQALYLNRVTAAQREWENGRVEMALSYLEACPGPRRRWEWNCLRNLVEGSLFTCYAPHAIARVACSPDGTLLAAAFGTDVQLWDAHTGRPIRTLNGERHYPAAVAFSPDGKRLATASRDGTVRLWDVRTGKATHTLRGHTDQVLAVAFDPEGKRLASGGSDQSVRVWDAESGASLFTLTGHKEEVVAVAFGPEGRLASARGGRGNDTPGEVRVWDARTGRNEFTVTLKETDSAFTSVAFAPDGTQFAAGSWDGTVRVWDAVGVLLRTLTDAGGTIHAVAFSPDGARIAAGAGSAHGGPRDRVSVWDARSGTLLHSLSGHRRPVKSVSFSPDGSRLVSGSDDATVRVWSSNAGTNALTFTGQTFWATALAFSPDGKRLVGEAIGVGGRQDRPLAIWDAHTGQRLVVLLGHTELIHSVAFSPDGSRVASASSDRTARLWDARTGALAFTLTESRGPARAVAFSPEGGRLASAGEEGVVRLADVKTGKVLKLLGGHTGPVCALAFSPDGTRLASGGGKSAGEAREIRVWDVESGETVLTLTGHAARVSGIAFNADGTRIAAGSWDTTARTWDANTGTPLATFRGHTQFVNGVAFSPDGTRLATAGADRTLRLWDAETGQGTLTLTGFTGEVLAVEFNPNGSRLAAASKDHQVRIYDARPTAPEVVLRGHTENIHNADYSPDGKRVATAGGDGTIQLWNAQNGESTHTLEGHGGRVLSVQFSPDGSKLVSCDFSTVRIWDAATGSNRRTLTGARLMFEWAGFTQDGRCVFARAAAEGYLFWNADTGERLERPTSPSQRGRPASPDGERLAFVDDAVIRLVATRPDADQERERTARTTPDADWHRWETARAETEGRWFAAAFHLGRLRALGTPAPRLVERLEQARSRAGLWGGMAELCAEHAAREPSRENLANLAWTQLAAGRVDEARQVCRRLAQEQEARTARDAVSVLGAPEPLGRLAFVYAATRARPEASLVTRVCVTPPDALDSSERLLRLAEGSQPFWRGPVRFRAGRFEDAAAVLRSEAERYGGWASAYQFLFLALTEHELGRSLDAHAAHRRAAAWLDAPSREDPKQTNFARLSWPTRAEFTALRREVEEQLHVAREPGVLMRVHDGARR